ncbi:anti-sigma regulatory factor (Ser/Thr protein kinase) [Spinactinospora alkalitolerans]|uniref:Anti-sigma regulatory factor (Ser/Thr protein kinase) n=1 Tax=Spinactinospora alkalitolerans TaxID=687207 RepID=A0A852U4U0_9ACTN|nr:ATP-binding protein [Spinactinospora alkalitolerans]NYE50627.1 anti-sigma regulatory factor (Ser/Thr protein kinase) [Spinactinospora alkalitolerans]
MPASSSHVLPAVRWWEPRLYPGEIAFSPRVRADARTALSGFPDRIAGDVELVVSELFANAVRYTASGDGGEVWVQLSMPDADLLRLDVADGGWTDTVPRIPALDGVDWLNSEGRRGLLLVEAVTLNWGYVDPYADRPYNLGLIVFAEFAVDPAQVPAPTSSPTTV